MAIQRLAVARRPYLYVARETGSGPEIGASMAEAFGTLMSFVAAKGIKPGSAPMAIYLGMDPAVLRYRAAFAVSEADCSVVEGEVGADHLPAGEAMTTRHIGPYAILNQTHRTLWSHMEETGVKGAFPIWETYLNDPKTTAPEDLVTEVWRMVAG